MDRVLFYCHTRSDYLAFDFRDPTASDIVITNIDGLSLTDTSLATADSGSGEGVSITAAHTQERNIVFDMTINPDSEIEAVRRKLYDYFPNGIKISVFFVSGEETYCIDGFCETVDADIFSQMQTFRVSLICPDPAFKRVNLYEPPKWTETMFYETHEDVVVSLPLHKKGDNPTWTNMYKQFTSQIHAVTGAVFTVTFFKDATTGTEFNFRFGAGHGYEDDFNRAGAVVLAHAEGHANALPNGKLCVLKILTDETPIKENDKIVIDSRTGLKSISLVRGEETVCNLLKYAVRADFPVLYPGLNRIYIDLNTSYTGLYIGDCEISVDIPSVYGGI